MPLASSMSVSRASGARGRCQNCLAYTQLSGQLYPYFKQNQGVAAGGAFFWDGHHERPETCVYAKQFWHLPLAPDARLTDIELDAGDGFP